MGFAGRFCPQGSAYPVELMLEGLHVVDWLTRYVACQAYTDYLIMSNVICLVGTIDGQILVLTGGSLNPIATILMVAL